MWFAYMLIYLALCNHVYSYASCFNDSSYSAGPFDDFAVISLVTHTTNKKAVKQIEITGAASGNILHTIPVLDEHPALTWSIFSVDKNHYHFPLMAVFGDPVGQMITLSHDFKSVRRCTIKKTKWAYEHSISNEGYTTCSGSSLDGAGRYNDISCNLYRFSIASGTQTEKCAETPLPTVVGMNKKVQWPFTIFHKRQICYVNLQKLKYNIEIVCFDETGTETANTVHTIDNKLNAMSNASFLVQSDPQFELYHIVRQASQVQVTKIVAVFNESQTHLNLQTKYSASMTKKDTQVTSTTHRPHLQIAEKHKGDNTVPVWSIPVSLVIFAVVVLIIGLLIKANCKTCQNSKDDTTKFHHAVEVSKQKKMASKNQRKQSTQHSATSTDRNVEMYRQVVSKIESGSSQNKHNDLISDGTTVHVNNSNKTNSFTARKNARMKQLRDKRDNMTKQLRKLKIRSLSPEDVAPATTKTSTKNKSFGTTTKFHHAVQVPKQKKVASKNHMKKCLSATQHGATSTDKKNIEMYRQVVSKIESGSSQNKHNDLISDGTTIHVNNSNKTNSFTARKNARMKQLRDKRDNMTKQLRKLKIRSLSSEDVAPATTKTSTKKSVTVVSSHKMKIRQPNPL